MNALRTLTLIFVFVAVLGGCSSSGSYVRRPEAKPSVPTEAEKAEDRKRREIEELHRSIKNRTGGTST